MNRIIPFFLFLLPIVCLGQNKIDYKWAFTTNQWDKTTDFRENRALISKEGLSGFIDTTGAEIIPLKYQLLDAYSEGLATAGFVDLKKMEFNSGYINRAGDFQIQPTFENLSAFQEGSACAKEGELYGFINTQGEYFIPPAFEETNVFAGGLAAVKKNGHL